MRCLFPPLTLLIVALAAGVLGAQEAPLTEFRAAFERLDYQAADSLGSRLLDDYMKLTPGQLVEVHQILGIMMFTEGRQLQARQHFERALSIDPQLRLDPVIVSPKIVSFLEQVRSEMDTDSGANPSLRYRYLLVPDPRPNAALRSLLLPGLGQLYKGNRLRGLGFLVASGAAMVTTVALSISRANARDEYLAEQDIQQIPARYDRYNRLNRQRNVAVAITGGIWLTSFLDALLSSPRHGAPGLSVRLHPSPATPSLAVLATLRF